MSHGWNVAPLLQKRLKALADHPLVEEAVGEAEIGEMFDRFERALKKPLDWATKEKLIAA